MSAGPGKKDVAASVQSRLLARARERGEDYQVLFAAYVHERFLHRLGVSSVRERFVLKGATLLRLWSANPYRATRDLDLLRKGDGSIAAIRIDLETICAQPVEPDGVSFDANSLAFDPIRAEDEYAGTRATLIAHSGPSRHTLQIDMGLGDVAYPTPVVREFPALLEYAAPRIFAYAPESVVAEKLEAIVVFGDRNSRIKDFFDLQYIADRFEFDLATLSRAVRETFSRRGTPLPTEVPFGLTYAYWRSPERAAHLRAFARRAGIEVESDPGPRVVASLRPFLLPVLENARERGDVASTWRAGAWR